MCIFNVVFMLFMCGGGWKMYVLCNFCVFVFYFLARKDEIPAWVISSISTWYRNFLTTFFQRLKSHWLRPMDDSFNALHQPVTTQQDVILKLLFYGILRSVRSLLRFSRLHLYLWGSFNTEYWSGYFPKMMRKISTQGWKGGLPIFCCQRVKHIYLK